VTGDVSIMERLKEATAVQHRNAEHRRLQRALVAGDVSADRYGAWLAQMLLLHRALWEEIARRRDAEPALRTVQDEGLHVANLRADLEALGVRPDTAEPLPATRRAVAEIAATGARDPVALLGYNYVLEGSMNGNRFIARALTPRLPQPATKYLDPYGEEQRPVWQAYRERMNTLALDPERAARVVEAARALFSRIADLSDELVGEPVSG